MREPSPSRSEERFRETHEDRAAGTAAGIGFGMGTRLRNGQAQGVPLRQRLRRPASILAPVLLGGL